MYVLYSLDFSVLVKIVTITRALFTRKCLHCLHIYGHSWLHSVQDFNMAPSEVYIVLNVFTTQMYDCMNTTKSEETEIF